ncbi:Sec-independent protein translocase protein TatB [Muricoccus nepalensis]|uniref:Sec-independent protein translocase protein TatB n=1 Tax=Muricoccus nepalensis TaxID=1854500 RepID=UPI0013868805|nr:Sec-independent protein translocase protein TatB [Roseomonas nepalensis]
MFDLAWSEIALIAVVAVVVIGPKDLPDAVRGIARGIQKLRRMAGEFQGHLDEVVREAKLEDVRDQIRDIRNFDLKSTIEKAVDEDGTLTRTMREDPFRAAPPPTSDAAPAAGTGAALPDGAPPADATTPASEVEVAGAADLPAAPAAFDPVAVTYIPGETAPSAPPQPPAEPAAAAPREAEAATSPPAEPARPATTHTA